MVACTLYQQNFETEQSSEIMKIVLITLLHERGLSDPCRLLTIIILCGKPNDFSFQKALNFYILKFISQ